MIEASGTDSTNKHVSTGSLLLSVFDQRFLTKLYNSIFLSVIIVDTVNSISVSELHISIATTVVVVSASHDILRSLLAAINYLSDCDR